jgi:hypothetical protein
MLTNQLYRACLPRHARQGKGVTNMQKGLRYYIYLRKLGYKQSTAYAATLMRTCTDKYVMYARLKAWYSRKEVTA